jgi:hypothetical protein
MFSEFRLFIAQARRTEHTSPAPKYSQEGLQTRESLSDWCPVGALPEGSRRDIATPVTEPNELYCITGKIRSLFERRCVTEFSARLCNVWNGVRPFPQHTLPVYDHPPCSKTATGNEVPLVISSAIKQKILPIANYDHTIEQGRVRAYLLMIFDFNIDFARCPFILHLFMGSRYGGLIKNYFTSLPGFRGAGNSLTRSRMTDLASV